MVEEITPRKLVRARKEYSDNCREFIMNVWPDDFDFTPEEKIVILKSISEGWKISKGEYYYHAVYKYDGMIYSFRSKEGLERICFKYDLFPEY